MTVQDKYVNASVESGKIVNGALVNGAVPIYMVATEELAAGDSALSVYRFFKGVSGNIIIIDIDVYVDDALTDETDADIGLYEVGIGGAAISKNVFADSLDLIPSGGAVRGAADIGDVIEGREAIDGMKSVDIANLVKKIYEHAGHDVNDSKAGYDICLTANTGITTTGGTVTMILKGIQG